MSPYLFVIVMEVFSKILDDKAKDPHFKFHCRCGKNKIINLCFADDLMVFCKGHPPFVQLIKSGLLEFQALSSLAPNTKKSHVFFSGCDPSLIENILRITQFQEGKLHVRYLGVPLISTRLKPLIVRVLWTGSLIGLSLG